MWLLNKKENGSSATISDGRMVYSCTRQALITAIASGIDKSTVVCFQFAGAGPARGTGFATLMELQAGSGSIVCESEGEDVNVPETSFVVDEEDELVFQDTIRDSLEEVVKNYMSEIAAGNIRKMEQVFRCTLCPFRSFNRLTQLADHVGHYHTAKHHFVCSGTKHLKIILAIFESDCIKREHGCDFLFRSSLLLRSQVQPILRNNNNQIDKAICLVFTSAGPIYVNKSTLGRSMVARRVFNIHYDRSFAEMLYREIVLHHSNVAWHCISRVLCFFYQRKFRRDTSELRKVAKRVRACA